MSRQFYRFEILGEAQGAPGHAVYEARDRNRGTGSNGDDGGRRGAGDGPNVKLFEWTPEPTALADSLSKLSTAMEEIPEVEIFSSGAAIYLVAASQENAKAALETLRGRGLFSGPWPGLFEEPPPPEPTPDPFRFDAPAATVKPAGTGSAAGKWVSAVVWAFLLVLVLVIVTWRWAEEVRRTSEAELRRARQRLEEQTRIADGQPGLEGQVKRLTEQASTAIQQRQQFESEVTRILRSAPEAQQVATAKLISESFDARQSKLAGELGFNGVHRIRLVNHCRKVNIDLVIHYKSLDDKWVTEGWWTLKPDEEIVLGFSQDPTYYVYTGDNVRIESPGSSLDTKDVWVVGNVFAYLEGEEILGTRKRMVKARRIDNPAELGLHPVTFTCS